MAKNYSPPGSEPYPDLINTLINPQDSTKSQKTKRSKANKTGRLIQSNAYRASHALELGQKP